MATVTEPEATPQAVERYERMASAGVFGETTGPADRPGYRASRHDGPGERTPVVPDGREVGAVAGDEILP